MLRRKTAAPESLVTPASILSADSKTAGRFDSDDDVILAGMFEGKLSSSRSVQLLAGSRLEGDVLASEIVVYGRVIGNLLARERIRIFQGSSVTGDVCAPQVMVQEGVELNGRVRMLATDHDTKEYLLPVLLRAEPGAAPRQWHELLSSTEEFLELLGFQAETRSKPGILMRSIFRTREPMTYAQFFQRVHSIETALREAHDSSDRQQEQRQASLEAAPAARLLEALGDGEGAVGILGSTVVCMREMPNGDMQRTIRARPEVLPEPNPAVIPKPGDLLLQLQLIHADVLGETTQLDGVPSR